MNTSKKMEVEIVGKEVIKPSSPTIKTFNLSFLDQQLYGSVYSVLIFFYKNTSQGAIEEIISHKTQCLKSSLSEVLTQYYPLAGKTKDIFSVYTGVDDGAEFIESRVNGTLSEYLAKPDIDLFLKQLFSDDYCESRARPLLIIQASFFACGGLAIGINISHRVADAASFSCFMKAWANTAIGNFDEIAKPDFSGSLIFPPSDHVVGAEAFQGLEFKSDFATRRFVFSESDIIGLREKATELGARPPSRVQTITAFLWRIGMKMSILKAGGSQIPSRLSMPVNLRSVLPPPICDQSFGNLFETFTVHNHSGNMDISNLTSLVREKIVELRKKYQDKFLHGEENFNGCLRNPTEMIELAFKQDFPSNFVISSWCNFPLYDADFGWGKPTWLANYNRAANCMVLVDTSDGTGIEAWVSFSEEDMVVFARDEELLAYSTLIQILFDKFACMNVPYYKATASLE